jgi:hypothetical protein
VFDSHTLPPPTRRSHFIGDRIAIRVSMRSLHLQPILPDAQKWEGNE